MPRPRREWIIDPGSAEADRLQQNAGVPRLVADLLWARSVRTPDAVRRFLSPSFKQVLPPESLPGAVEAGRRLAQAARDGRRIVIYGDYDVDGMTATTILWHCLRLADADVGYYVPDRLEEGYGLNAEALRALADEGAEVIVTVDCGVTAVDEARLARELGVELIITDHHQAGPVLPDALLVHPSVPDESVNAHLSGSGVALKVAWALARELVGQERVSDAFREYLLDATAFAALGLVADVVPLLDENRAITIFGLRHLVQTRNAGLQALIEVAGLAGKRSYDDYDVGFRLAPRLNAIGRLGHAREAIELFTTADTGRAMAIARQLDRLNRERQEMQKQIVAQAEAMVVEHGFHRDNCRGIVLASPEWHPGVVGIVASHLAERFGRPTVLIAAREQIWQGSGRSVPHFPLHEVLQECGNLLVSHGGHAMAAGLRIEPGRLEQFTDAFLAEAANRLTPHDLLPKLRLDACVSLAEMTTELVEWLERLAPHGPGNPRVMLASEPVELVGAPRRMGSGGTHLSFTVREGRVHRRAVAFFRGDRADELADMRTLRLAFEPMINTWNGRRNVELKVSDWQAG